MYSWKSRLRYSEIDENGQITLRAVMNYLQDCALFHTQDAGGDMDWLSSRNRVWVLNSWQIVLKQRPSYFEMLQIETQPYEFRGSLGMRNFRITGEDGRLCVIANSVWCLLEHSSGRPVRVTQEDISCYEQGSPLEMEYAPRKIVPAVGGEEKPPIPVIREYLDTNHHVNNGQYVILAAEYLPEGFEIGQVRAEYIHQAVLGESMIPVLYADQDIFLVQLNSIQGDCYARIEFQQKRVDIGLSK